MRLALIFIVTFVTTLSIGLGTIFLVIKAVNKHGGPKF